jgi:hypothetical protein
MYALPTRRSLHSFQPDFRQCAQCDSECNKASSLMMASEAERRETVPEEAEEQEHTSENNPRDEMNLFGYGPEFCPKHCVGNRNACVEVRSYLCS